MNAHRLTRRLRPTLPVLAAALAALSAPVLVAAQMNPNFEYGVDRRGGDYRSFPMRFDAPALCAAQCAQEGPCRAWTYVRPGVQGPAAMCWLKSVVPAPLGNASYAISGLRPGVAQPVAPQPVAQPAPAAGVNAAILQGSWQLSTCGGRYGAMMGIQPTGPATFAGAIENGRGTITNGRIVGNRITFDQILSPSEWASYSGQLVSDGGRLKVVNGVMGGPLQQKYCPDQTGWAASK